MSEIRIKNQMTIRWIKIRDEYGNKGVLESWKEEESMVRWRRRNSLKQAPWIRVEAIERCRLLALAISSINASSACETASSNVYSLSHWSRCSSVCSSQTPPRVTQPDATSWATSFHSSLVARGLVGTTVSRLISSITGSWTSLLTRYQFN